MTESKRRRLEEVKGGVIEQDYSSMEEKRCGDLLTLSDVWMYIFLLLPPADLLSLKAVCKSFHQLISSDCFLWMSLKKDLKSTTAIIISTNPTASNLLYDSDKRLISVWHNEPVFDFWCIHHHASNLNTSHRVVDAYLGLLLVRICGSLLIWYPIKKSYHLLPSISSGFSLRFPCWKIAYDNASDQYKVFGLDIIKRNQVSLYVFDGQSRRHRKTTTSMEQVADGVTYNIIRLNVLVNDNVYWLILAEKTKKRQLRRWDCVVVSANVTTEQVKTRICSTTQFHGCSNIFFFVANGTFYSHDFSYSSTYFDIWFLEGIETLNPNPTWMLKHRLDITIPSITQYHKTRVLGLFRNKLLLKITPGQQYYQYDLSRDKFEEVRVAKADAVEPELIGDDTKCEMRMGPVDIATQVSVGFIPPPIYI